MRFVIAPAGAATAVVVVVAGAVVVVVEAGVRRDLRAGAVVGGVVDVALGAAVVAGVEADGEVGAGVSAKAGPRGPAIAPTKVTSSTASAVRKVLRPPTENTPGSVLRPRPDNSAEAAR